MGLVKHVVQVLNSVLLEKGKERRNELSEIFILMYNQRIIGLVQPWSQLVYFL